MALVPALKPIIAPETPPAAGSIHLLTGITLPPGILIHL